MKLFILIIFCLKLCTGSEYLNLGFMYMKRLDYFRILNLEVLCLQKGVEIQFVQNASAFGISVNRNLNFSKIAYCGPRSLILMDLSCADSIKSIQKAESNNLFRTPFSWLIFHKHDNASSKAFDYLLGRYLGMDSNVVIAELQYDGGYLLYEAYKVFNTSRVTFTPLGAYAAGNLNLSETRLPAARRNDFKGETIIFSNVIVLNESKNHLDDRQDLKNDGMTKLTWAIGRVCLESLNASVKASFTTTWGYKNNNGVWNGMIRQFLDDEAHLGSILIFSKERTEAVDFLAKIGSTSLRFILRRPPLSFVANIYILPFTINLWWSVLFSLFCSSITIYAINKQEVAYHGKKKKQTFRLSDSVLMLVGVLSQQGNTFHPKKVSSRITTMLVFLSLMIIYSAYCAHIVVLMRATSPSPRCVEDLLSSPISLGAIDIDYNHYFLSRLNDSIRRDIYRKKIAPPGKKANFYTWEEGVEKLRRGLFALHTETSAAYQLIQEKFLEDEKCDLKEITFISESSTTWLPAQKNSPFKKIFKTRLQRLNENGIQSALESRMMMSKPQCSGDYSMFSHVGFQDFYPAAVLLVIGMVTSFIILILEIVVDVIKLKKVFPYID